MPKPEAYMCNDGLPSHKWNSWESIDWLKCEITVKKLQVRIEKAYKEEKHHLVVDLQKMLILSFCARALAVRRVTTNKGKNTPGVDLVLWRTPKEKYRAIGQLKSEGYRSRSLRRIYIEKKNGKLRPISIPTMKDRAMQALYLMALEPISEIIADKNSYGFRKGKSVSNAIWQCKDVLIRNSAAIWVFEGDIKSCFDHISHKWLMKHIPIDKEMLEKWLTCGYIYETTFYPVSEGAPQGGIISPVLANMTLDGMEQLLNDRFNDSSKVGVCGFHKVAFVRFADDFIIISTSKTLLKNKVMPVVTEFLGERGLLMSEEKTKITSIHDGFDFLGFNIRKSNKHLYINPSEDNFRRFKSKIRNLIEQNKDAGQDEFIQLLYPVIYSWLVRYRQFAGPELFRKVDDFLSLEVLRWAIKRKLTDDSKNNC